MVAIDTLTFFPKVGVGTKEREMTHMVPFLLTSR